MVSNRETMMPYVHRQSAARLLSIAPMAAIVAAFVLVLSLIVKAQTPAPPTDEELASDLNRPGAAFHATVGSVTPSFETLKRGREIAQNGGKAGVSAACTTCHGFRGEGNDAMGSARLAGLPAWYFSKQIKDYASGMRKNVTMAPIAAGLTDDEATDVAAYYAVLPAPELVASTVDNRTWYGARLANSGDAEKAIPACVNCHGPSGTGLSPSVPYLAGQHSRYLARQLRDWREGSRANDNERVMHAVAEKMTDKDVRAVTEFYQNLAH
jgi:cytochrome c553